MDILTRVVGGTNNQSEPKHCVQWKSKALEVAEKTRKKDMVELRPFQWEKYNLTLLEISPDFHRSSLWQK